jgi:hypothetical protein
MFAVGGLSLWRSYATTMRFYTSAGPAPKPGAAKSKLQTPRRLSNGIERNIPFLSEQVAAITLVGIRSLLRSPEAKMALLTPIIMVCAFGGVIVVGPGRAYREHSAEWLSPLLGIGIIGFSLFGLAQLMINIFGTDRGGFRAFVLMPVPRRDVLLGKNLAVVAIAGCIVIGMIVVLQCLMGMRVVHLLATLVQLVPAYLLLSLIGNAASIAAPMAMPSGSLKPMQIKFSSFLAQMFFVLLTPLAVVPAAVAFGAEALLAQATGARWLPIYLVVSLIEAGLVMWIYRRIIKAQGDWLQKRESRILEILAEVPE